MELKGRALAWYLAAWCPFAVLYAVAVALSGAAPLDAAFSGLVSTGSAALLGALAWRLAPRWTAGASRVAWLLRHLAGAAVYSGLWTLVIVAQILQGAPHSTWEGFLANAVRWQFISGVVLYGLVMAALSFADANHRLQRETKRAEEAERLRMVAELQALRAQLNPHFLFNSLHSITALIRQQPHLAERLLEQLAACFRHVLDVNRSTAEEVSLADELSFVRDYLALESMRFGDRLRIEEDIDPEALDASVLVFLLQPLVENAIRHGLAPMERPVTLRLTASTTNEWLNLEVADDGAGGARNAPGGGVGLRVVRDRLRTRYGDAATLTTTTAPGEGYRVHVRLPLRAASVRPLIGATP